MGVRYLRNVSFLRNLPKRDLERFLGLAEVRSYDKGDMVFRQEESGDHLYVVLAGLIKIYFASTSRRRKTMAMLEPGDFFGEMSLLDGQVRSANAMAMRPSRVLAIHKRDFKNLLEADHNLMFVVLRTLSERLRRADDQIKSLIFKNVHGRVVKTLLDLALRGKKVDGSVVLSVPMTRQELAEIVGTTREPITRSLGLLRRAGFIEYRDKDIVIKDLERLKKFA